MNSLIGFRNCLPNRSFIQTDSRTGCLLIAALIIYTTAAPVFQGYAESPAVNIVPWRGAPAFMLDGRAQSGFSFMTYVGSGKMENGAPVLARYTRSFAEAGCEFFTFVIDIGGVYGYTPTIWPERGRWDFSYLDTTANMVLDAGGPKARLIIQLYIDAPAWWLDENPGELMILSNGSNDFGDKLFALPRKDRFPSLASERWRTDMKTAIEALIDHVAESAYGDRVAGYQVCGQKTEEWYHWSMNTPELGDYSAPMQRAFQSWLKDKYREDARLQKAWNRPEARLDSVSIPTKEERYGNPQATFRIPEKEMPVIDFHRFWSDIMADTMSYFARVVKEGTAYRKAVGGFYAYTFEFADLAEDAGHLALGRLLKSPYIDFIMSPSSYYRRDLKGGQSCFRMPVSSLNLHGKMLWNDFDPASFKFYQKDQAALAPWKPMLAVTDTPEEFTYMIRRELGNALANGVNMACFDLHGGYYDDPIILSEVKRSAALRTEALQHDRRSSAEILVLVDEDSMHYVSFRNPLLRRVLIEQLAELPFTAPYDAALLSDLAQMDTARYKLALVVNAFKLDDEQRAVLHTKLLNNGKTVLWLYAPGYFDGETGNPDPKGIKDITGIGVKVRPRLDDGVAATFEQNLAPAVPLLPGDQFTVEDTEAVFLARRNDAAQEPVVASKNMGEWTSIYSAVAPIPRQALRAWAASAGVHLYHDNPNDTVYANARYLTLAAGVEPGTRTLRLPAPAKVRDVISGEVVCDGAQEFQRVFSASETRIFEVETVADANPSASADPWYNRLKLGTEVGPTGAQFGCDSSDAKYARLFNGHDIVATQIAANAQYLVIWAKDSEFAYYNSKVAPKCPGLGERDVLRETMEAAKPFGLPVIAYCVIQGNGYPLREHPEYKMLAADNTPIDRICLNSGFIDHAKMLASEMISYGIDGFHIDMLDQGFGPPYGCWCPQCRERFEAEYQRPMPPGVTWDADWDRMMTFRFNSSARFEREMREYIRSVNPAVTVDFNYHGSPPFSWEVGQRPVQHALIGDFVTGETGIWGFSALGVGLSAEFLSATRPGDSYQIAMQRGIRMYHDQTVRPLNDIRWEMFTLLAHRAQVTIVDKTPNDGSMDPVAFARIGQAFSEARAKQEHFGHAPVQDVGLFYSSRARDWYGRETPAKYQQPFNGAHKALALEHIPWGVALDENLSVERLQTFPVVFLPNTAIILQQEADMIRAYVSEGGNVVLTGVTGLFDAMGQPRADCALGDLIGAEFVEILNSQDNHIRLPKTFPEGMTGLGRDIPSDWAYLVEGPAVVWKPTTAVPVGELMKPVRTVLQQKGKEGVEWPNSADATVGPALLVNKYGKGTVVTVAASPDAATAGEHPVPEARFLLRNIVRFLHPNPAVTLEAPAYVETVVSDDPDSRSLRVHFLGYLSTAACTPAKNRPYVLPGLIEDDPLYRARIRAQRPFVAVTAADLKTEVQTDGADVQLLINNIYEVITIRY